MWAQLDASLEELERTAIFGCGGRNGVMKMYSQKKNISEIWSDPFQSFFYPLFADNRSSVLSLLTQLDGQLTTMADDLETLSAETQSAKQTHLIRDSENHAMLDRLRYIQAVKELSTDIDRFRSALEKIKPAQAVSTMKEALISLKSHIQLIYSTARSHSTLVDPIGRAHHRTWDTTPLSSSKSPMKREVPTRPDSVGMRLLLPSDTVRSAIALLDIISKLSISVTLSWLDAPEKMELVEAIASKVALSLVDYAPGTNCLLPSMSSMEIQLPQQLFWICRTCQELKTLLVGPPSLTSTSQGTSRFLSPRSPSKADTLAISSYIASFGPASQVFAKYWALMEDFLVQRFSRLQLPKDANAENIEAHLQKIHEINARFWIMNKLLWFDTPNIQKEISEHVDGLDTYLSLHIETSPSSPLLIDLPLDVPQLAAFSLPHAQLELIAARFANIVDSMALLPVYEASASKSPSIDEAMRTISQLNLFWANALSGPWYPLAASGFPATTLVLRFLPAIQSLRSATFSCARAIELATATEKSAYADTTIWTQKKPETAYFSFLTSCLCMLVCSPGSLAVEDFLLDSLATPLSANNPKLAHSTYKLILNFLLAPQAEDAHPGSFWTHDAVMRILDTLKLGSIKTVLLIRLQDLIQKKKDPVVAKP